MKEERKEEMEEGKKEENKTREDEGEWQGGEDGGCGGWGKKFFVKNNILWQEGKKLKTRKNNNKTEPECLYPNTGFSFFLCY